MERERPGQVLLLSMISRPNSRLLSGNNTLQIDCLQMQKRWWWHYVMHPLFFYVGGWSKIHSKHSTLQSTKKCNRKSIFFLKWSQPPKGPAEWRKKGPLRSSYNYTFFLIFGALLGLDICTKTRQRYVGKYIRRTWILLGQKDINYGDLRLWIFWYILRFYFEPFMLLFDNLSGK